MNIKRFMRMYSETAGAELSSISAYRVSFFLNLLSKVVDALLGPLTVWIIYSVTPGFEGWSLPEILVFMGSFNVTLGLAHFLIMGLSWVSADLSITGNFDTVLLKPVNTIGYMISRVIDFDGLGQLLSGLVVTIIGLLGVNRALLLSDLLFYSLFVIDGFMFWFAINLLIGGLCFRYHRFDEWFSVFYSFTNFATYPLNIYGSFLGFIFTFVIPIGVISYYPAQALLGRLTDASLFAIITGVMLLIFSLSVRFYNKSLRNYFSAGG